MADEEYYRSEGDLNTSHHREAWRAEHLDEATREALAADERVFLHQALSTPCLNHLKECDGSYLIDEQGRRILDFHGNSVHQVGYRHPAVLEAIRHQLETLPFCPRRYGNTVATRLAERLAELAPGDLNRVLFAPGGTSAIGMALKLARAATGKHKTISMWESFHGASLDAISIGGEAMFRKGAGPLLPGCEHAPPCEPTGCPFRCGRECSLQCADYVEYMLEKEGDDVAAVIAETIRWTPSVPPKDYWKRIRAACDRHGALLILDEIPSALGRTGRMFACEHYDVVPDMLVIGKGLGGGVVPLAALIARESLNAAMANRALGHYTHEKNPVACAAGLATVGVIQEKGFLETVQERASQAEASLHALRAAHASVGRVRGIGLLWGIEIVTAESPDEPDPEGADRVLYECLRRGLSFKVTMGNVLTLTPPLTISEAEWGDAVGILDRAIAEVSR